jgi:tetratricopeptide (TPR) repeat protein
LREYVDAAYAYDYAFQLYAQLAADNTSRPYRMMWYQTGPYWAYYYSGRYQDVINLADVTLQTPTDGPVLEESLLWRGRAYLMIGQREAAIEDFRAALRVHPRWAPALQALQELGIQP